MPPVRSRFLSGYAVYDAHVYGRVYVPDVNTPRLYRAQNALTPVWSEANLIAIDHGTLWDIIIPQI
jgi:hypothetical protein